MKNLPKLPLKPTIKTPLIVACGLIMATFLAACGDGIKSGASAGDTAEDANIQAAITILQPFVGVYQLDDNWMGNMGDQAYLSIRLTGNDGISEAALIDFDDIDSCVPAQPSLGEVRKDPFSDRVFMDDILQFSQAEISLIGSDLSIEMVDSFDIDNDENTTEIVTIGATSLAIAEVDLGDPC